MKEKPNWMPHRDWFVKKLSEQINVNEEVVKKVIKHQFDSVVNATQKNRRVEISGFGILIWHDPKALRKIERMDGQIAAYREKIANNPDGEDAKRWSDIIDEILVKRKMLMNRINELDENLRGVEK